MNNSNFYSITPGTTFKTLIEHFRQQARGGAPNIYVKTPGQANRTGPGLRYVKLGSEKHTSDTPKIEVTDLNEAINKRAASQLKQDLSDKSEPLETPVQSIARSRKRKTTSKTSTAAASKVIKRAKDLFDS